MASGQSQRLDGIIVVEHHLHPANLELYLVFRSRYPLSGPHTCFPSFVRIPPQMAVTMQLK